MIDVRQLTKKFGAQTILESVDLRIESGESAVIIGRSGGGKSVLIKHIVGLLQPDSGEVWVDGESIVGKNERQLLRVREKFGMVFQGAALFDSMTVAENVAFPLQRERQEKIGHQNRDRGIHHRLGRRAAHAFRAHAARHAFVTADEGDDAAVYK